VVVHDLDVLRSGSRPLKADSVWSAEHIARHDVTLAEVREAILEHPYWMTSGKNDTTLIYGRTYAGRYLLVVAVDDHGGAFDDRKP
jgi:hypothetical protein